MNNDNFLLISKKKWTYIALLSSFIYVIIYIFFLPVIAQDDGWYASLSRSYGLTGKQNLLSVSPGSLNEDLALGSSYLFVKTQSVLFEVFGVNLFVSRIISLLSILGILYLSFLICKKYFGLQIALISCLFFSLNANFLMHSWNRREMPALFLIFLSFYFLFVKNKEKNFNVFIGFMIIPLAIDMHPMSIALALFFSLYFFVVNYTKYVYVLSGFISGIFLILAGKALLLGGFIDLYKSIIGFDLNRIDLSDHFIPILNLDKIGFDFFAITAKKKFYLIYRQVEIYAILILLIVVNKRSLQRKSYFIVGIMLVFLLSTSMLFSTYANGFRLYAFIPIIFLCFNLLDIINKTQKEIFKVFVVFIFFALLNDSPYILYHNIANYENRKIEHKHVSTLFNSEDVVGMSPYYFFDVAESTSGYIYFYQIQVDMKNYDLSFKDAIKLRNYTILGIDESISEFLFNEEYDKKWDSHPYYRQIPRIYRKEFNSLVKEGFLVYAGSVESSYSIGKIDFYRVNEFI